MTSSPDISVVLPVRNGRRYVAGALASILAQEGAALEVVVVDDGSTDGTRQAVERVADGRVRVIPGPEQGVAAAMNAGLAAARGRYIARCDGDDRFLPGRLAAQMAFLEASEAYGAVCGRFEMLDAAGNRIAVLPAAGEEAREITADLRRGQVEVHLCTYLVRREPMLATGGFRSYFRTSSDIDFQLLLCQDTRVWYEPATWYGYRIHDDSITHRHSTRLQIFYEDIAREFQRQRVERGAVAGEFGKDDLQLGIPPAAPEQGEAIREADRPSAREQLWLMKWGEAWREHSEGHRGAALRRGLQAALQQPWRLSAWRGLIALGVKPAVPLPDYRGPRPHQSGSECRHGILRQNGHPNGHANGHPNGHVNGPIDGRDGHEDGSGSEVHVEPTARREQSVERFVTS